MTFVRCLIAVALLMTGTASASETDPRAIPLFSVSKSVSDLLRVAQAQKKFLYFQLSNGMQYVARVKDVGQDAVLLTELQGKEFFDAWVRLDAIVALEERVRLR